MGLFDMFCQFHFIKVTKEVESLIVASLVAWLPRLASCLGGPGRRACYRVCALPLDQSLLDSVLEKEMCMLFENDTKMKPNGALLFQSIRVG